MNDDERDAIAIEQLTRLSWSVEAVKLGIRDNFKCRYCQRDLLASVDAYDAWHFDHVVPSSKDGPDNEGNKVVSCKTCNFFKRNYDPREDSANDTLDELVEKARNYIEQKRNEKLAHLNEIRNVLLRTGHLDSGRFEWR